MLASSLEYADVPIRKLGFALLFGVGVSLWSANAGMKALFDALNVVYGEEERRSFLKLNAVSLAFTLGALLFMVFALAAIGVLPVVMGYLSLSNATEWLVTLGKWAILLIGVALAVSLIYRYAPSREKPQWRWVTWGSAVVAIAWLAMSVLFSWYAAHFGSYNKTYGSLGAVIGFMTWIWLSTTVVLLLGAELDAEMEHQPCATRPPDQRSREAGDTPSGRRRVCWKPPRRSVHPRSRCARRSPPHPQGRQHAKDHRPARQS